MKKALFALLAALLYISLGASPAFANVGTTSNDPSYAAGPFQFYCLPYLYSFEADKHYTSLLDYPQCQFSIPTDISTAGKPIIGIYKGTPGNAKITAGDLVFFTATLAELGTSNFIEYDNNNTPIYPKQDDDFFAVVYAVDQDKLRENVTAFTSFFTTGTPPPNNHYKILRWKWGAKPASEFDPVIIIPGIMGSWEDNGTWVLDPLLHTYDNLINTFKANGYVEGKTIFSFPYDWEQSNVLTAKLLKQKIAQVKTVCNCQKVDLVAHSMGGLAASHYIESADYQNDVDQFFMLGTPIGGSVKAYKAWEAGELDFGDFKVNTLLKRVFDREATNNGYSSIFEYIRGKPVTSIQELLPITLWPNYLQMGTQVLAYPTGYPRNTFLENLTASYSTKILPRVQTYVVSGDMGATSTLSGFTVKPSTQLPKWEHGEPISSKFGKGDGTVLFDSSDYISGPEKELVGSSHMDLASSSASYVYRELTGKDPITLIGTMFNPFLTPDWWLFIKKISPSPTEFKILADTLHDLLLYNPFGRTVLFIVLFSPIDMQITAPDGKHLGKDFSTGTTLNEIPNATYSAQVGEHEYAIILDPLPGQYKVDTKGTGSGAYTIATTYISNATTSVSLLAGTTTLNQLTANTLLIAPTTTVAISIKPTLPPTPPVATSSPTTTQITPDTCIKDITAAYTAKQIGKKVIYEKLAFDCKALKEYFKTRDMIEKIPTNKRKITEKTTLIVTYAVIRITIIDMEGLARDKDNTKDAVLLIGKITTWFKTHDLQ